MADGQTDIQLVFSWYQSRGNISAPIGYVLLNIPYHPVPFPQVAPQSNHPRINAWASWGASSLYSRGTLIGPTFPAGKDLELLEHHLWGLDSLARRYHFKAEPPFGVRAELHCAETKVVYHHSHRVLAREGDKGQMFSQRKQGLSLPGPRPLAPSLPTLYFF